VKGRFAYRDASYVEINEEEDKYMCNLCNTGWMNDRARKNHFHGSRHAKNYKLLSEEQNRRNALRGKAEFGAKVMQFIYNMKSLDDRVAQLGLRKWKLEMHHLMYRFVTVELMYGAYVTKEYVLDRLHLYETMEKLSLLEMALWKTNICTRSSFSSVQQVKASTLSVHEFDRDKFLREARITSGSEVIVPLVLKFLRGNNAKLPLNPKFIASA